MKEFMDSNVIYTKSKGYDPKVWDDSILIKAYDEAIGTFKKSIGVEENVNKKNKTKNIKKKGKQEAVCGWKVGNRCKAVFTEDKDIYEATIISIDALNQSCIIKYRFYGNEETHLLKDLIPMSSNSKSVSDASSLVDKNLLSGECSTSERSMTSESGDIPFRPKKNKKKPTNFKHPATSSNNPFSIPPLIQNGMPNTAFNNLPQIPPPPIPDISSCDGENEALKGMLISWYMSGYYAGYFQGLKSIEK